MVLHDIGKTMVNLLILNKPSKLNDDEFRIIKNHPEYGWDILRKHTSLPATVCASVYEHHENEDGSGYPRGISGDQIYRYAKMSLPDEYYPLHMMMTVAMKALERMPDEFFEELDREENRKQKNHPGHPLKCHPRMPCGQKLFLHA